MTLAEYEALPSRGDHHAYVVGTVYRYPENPTTVFLYEGKDGWRAAFFNGCHGLERNDIWLARELVITEASRPT